MDLGLRGSGSCMQGAAASAERAGSTSGRVWGLGCGA